MKWPVDSQLSLYESNRFVFLVTLKFQLRANADPLITGCGTLNAVHTMAWPENPGLDSVVVAGKWTEEQTHPKFSSCEHLGHLLEILLFPFPVRLAVCNPPVHGRRFPHFLPTFASKGAGPYQVFSQDLPLLPFSACTPCMAVLNCNYVTARSDVGRYIWRQRGAGAQEGTLLLPSKVSVVSRYQ